MNEDMLRNEGVAQPIVPQEPRRTGLATVALVCGILALNTTLFFINYVYGLIGVICAIVYLCRKEKKYGKGRAIVGLILAILSLFISTSLWVGIGVYVTTSSIEDIIDDIKDATDGIINPEEIINDFIQSNVRDPEAIQQLLGKELNYDTLCEFVGEDVSIRDISNFMDEEYDFDEFMELLSETDGVAVRNDLGGEVTYEALEDKIDEDFTYEDLKEYLEDFKLAK